MKKTMVLIICIVILALSLCGCNTDNEKTAAEVVMDIATTQYFTDEAVSDADLEKILLAGINAPSAMNGQKWHFSAVTDRAVLEDIASSMAMPGGTPPPMPAGDENTPPPKMNKTVKAGLTDAPVAVVISCPEGSDFDAGLACQNMSAEAQLLGYGTKILSSTTIALNGERKAEFDEILGVPESYSAVAVLLIGKEDTSVDESLDGYTSATTRNPFNEVVTYVK